MAFEIKVPEVGESITEGVIAEWLVEDGAVVESGQDIYVLETDKITTNVPAERSGMITINVSGGETVEIGQTVATIDTVASADDAGEKTASASAPEGDESPPEEPGEDTAPPKEEGDDDDSPDLSDLSPAVRRMVAEHDLDPSEIEGTGRGGRLTKEDVVRYVEDREDDEQKADEKPEKTKTADAKEPEHDARPEEPAPSKKKADVERFPKPRPSSAKPAAAAADTGERQTREPMSRLRIRIAERLVEVQQTAAILTTFNEADMSRIMALRSEFKAPFKERHGIGLGFMSFFVKASVEALRSVPEVNTFIDGTDLVRNHYYDVGVAVSTDKGLVVPVVRDADRKSMAEIEAEIADLATRAHERRLELTDLQGAVFTVSNGGIFGSMLSTPILNPPGSAILGMHAIQKRPVVVDDEIVIRPMMNLAVSYDHRVIDGREAVSFLKRIKECLENPERMLLEV